MIYRFRCPDVVPSTCYQCAAVNSVQPFTERRLCNDFAESDEARQVCCSSGCGGPECNIQACTTSANWLLSTFAGGVCVETGNSTQTPVCDKPECRTVISSTPLQIFTSPCSQPEFATQTFLNPGSTFTYLSGFGQQSSACGDNFCYIQVRISVTDPATGQQVTGFVQSGLPNPGQSLPCGVACGQSNVACCPGAICTLPGECRRLTSAAGVGVVRVAPCNTADIVFGVSLPPGGTFVYDLNKGPVPSSCPSVDSSCYVRVSGIPPFETDATFQGFVASQPEP